MLAATLYKFSKKENSTAQPTAQTPSLPVSININDGDSSILSPSIRLPSNQSGVPSGSRLFDYNYIYIADFNRYYYVSNWSFNGDGTWTAYCNVDELASWKTDIVASPGYVGRSQSYYDQYIQDRFYPARNTPVTIRDNANTGFTVFANAGTYVLGVSSSKATSTHSNGTLGSVHYYMMTESEFKSLSQSLLGIYNASGVITQPLWMNKSDSTFKADAWQSLNNPIQYVVSCRYYPVLLFDPTTTTEQIMMGGWLAGGQGGRPMNRLYDEIPASTGEIPISNVNQVGEYNADDYPTYAPYANYILQSPWGEFMLDPNIMATILRRETPKLYWKLMINYTNGNGTFVVMDTPGAFPEMSARTTRHELVRTEVKVGTDIALVATYQDEKYVMNVGKGLVASIGDIIGAGAGAMGGGAMGAMGAIGSGITSTGNLLFGIADAAIGAEKSAQGSTFTESNNTPVCTQITVQQTRYSTVGRSPEMFGKPYKQAVQNLNGFSGFVQMDYTQFKANCTDVESKNIIMRLLGGVYIE